MPAPLILPKPFFVCPVACTGGAPDYAVVATDGLDGFALIWNAPNQAAADALTEALNAAIAAKDGQK